MPDVTTDTDESLAFFHSRDVMRAAGRALPFPSGHLFGKIERKLKDELKEFFEGRDAKLQEMMKDGKATQEGAQIMVPKEHIEEFNAAVAAIKPGKIILTNIRLPHLKDMGTVELTDIETSGLAPFIDDSGDAHEG